MIGDDYWDGEIEYIQQMAVSPELLTEGNNTLTIELPGDTGASVDVIYYNWIEIDYLRYFEAVQDKLKFNISGDGRFQIEIKKMSKPDIMIYDITDPDEVKELVNFSIESEGADYKAIFEDKVSGYKTYYVLTDSQIRQPDNIELYKPAKLKKFGNKADYIIVTDRDFLPSVEPLIQFRKNQGLHAIAISMEDIYNEFNYGLVDPGAIKEFLKYAYENWQAPAPTYVLLIGDANIDYRDYLGTGKEDKVPAHLSVTPEIGLTPDDNWYVCIEGEDNIPDMLIGRIPVSSKEMAEDLVNKVIGYEESADYKPQSVLLVADNDDMAFEELNEDLISYLPSEFNADKVYLRLYEDVGDATQDITSSIDEGMMITNYVGHGSVTNWAGEEMFSSSDIASLNNGDKLTFVITLNCLNGYFSQPFYYSLAEEFAAQDKGAIASFAPSGLGYTWEHEILDKEVFSIIFEEKNNILGYITTQSKIAAYASGVSEENLKTFTLFGDPALRLKDWK